LLSLFETKDSEDYMFPLLTCVHYRVTLHCMFTFYFQH